MNHAPPRLFAWPGRRLLARAAVFAVALTAWFYLIYGGADWITDQHTQRLRVHFEIERFTPFVPEMIVVYHSLCLLFAAAPFVLRTAHELNAFAATLTCVIFLAGVCFLSFPAELAYSTHRDWGAWSGWYALADWLNLRYNLAPSLHVALGIVCVDLFARRASPAGKGLLWVWGAAIALSTVLTHEHHLLDAATGFLLALAGTRIIYPRLMKSLSSELSPHKTTASARPEDRPG
jgi:hypothetical protein